MSAVRTPRNVAQATVLLSRYAAIESDVAEIESVRNGSIARANELADERLAPALAELAEIRAKLEPWWASAHAELAGKRKSIELGGCKVGMRLTRSKLVHGFEDEDKATEALRGTRYARQTVRVRYSVDRAGTSKLLQLGGKTAETIAALGFSVEPGVDEFFVERAEQDGTLGPGR